MLASVPESAPLLLQNPRLEIPVMTPGAGSLDRAIEVNQQIGVSDALPHVRDVGVFLEHLPRVEAVCSQPGHQRRLAGCTYANDSNERSSIVQ